jgi:MYXO-CTERM domain-containing protein
MTGTIWTTGALGQYLVPNPDDPAARVLAGQPAPARVEPTLTLTASPLQILPGDTVSLSWQAANVNQCVASSARTGSKPLSGAETVNPPGPASVNYILSCDGDYGPVSRSVFVKVASNSSTSDSGGGALGLALLISLLGLGLLRRRRAAS